MKRTFVPVLRAVLLGGLVGIACDRTLARQPAPPAPSPSRAEPPAGVKPGRADQSRRRTREDLQALRDRADAAIRRIDEGADPALVREEFDRNSPWRSGGRGGRSGRPEGTGREGGPGDDRSTARALPGFEVTPEERQKILRFLDEHVPRVGAKFREMDKTNPELVTRLLARMRPRVREVLESGQNDPGGAELKISEFRTSLDVMWARRGVDEARGGGPATIRAARRCHPVEPQRAARSFIRRRACGPRARCAWRAGLGPGARAAVDDPGTDKAALRGPREQEREPSGLSQGMAGAGEGSGRRIDVGGHRPGEFPLGRDHHALGEAFARSMASMISRSASPASTQSPSLVHFPFSRSL